MQSNISLVEQMYAAYAKADVAAILSFLADDVVWSAPDVAPIRWGGTRHGHQETIGFFEGLNEQLSDPVLEVTETLANDDSVATFGRFEATIRHTGRRVGSEVAHYFRFRDGKVVEFRDYLDTAAFVAALLEPASTSESLASSAGR
ncbi:MAG: nuclear transport factor 2 family protein [Acidobacteria bacterium]|nr:nuclear transport factor 2 family protein [Acidobacteriota bacterium]